jgi:hypothetical protein
MNETDPDKSMEETGGSNKTTEPRSTRKKSALKISTDQTEKKRKAPKIPSVEPDEIKSPEDDTQTVFARDQEVPVKPKKKRAPKIEINDESIPIEQPIKKKKSKAPKPPPIDDDFQPIETPIMEELEPPIERKPKRKKSKKTNETISKSFEDLQITNLDGTYSPNSGISHLTCDKNYFLLILEINPDDVVPSLENETSEYEKAILDAFNNLGSQVNFAEYVGNDQWCIIQLPKAARIEPKSRLRKILPGGSKDDKLATKPPVPKESLFKRIRSGMNTLVRNENNLIFGERANYDIAQYEEEEDGVDTDDLHRYAQKLRELEDQDREVNPEFLVLRDGKTVYGVHESDVDGKVKLSARKPIYDRFADQKPDDQSEKRKLLSRLKIPFTRSKDKDEKDSQSANATPVPSLRRKSSRKSLNNDLETMANDNPLMI